MDPAPTYFDRSRNAGTPAPPPSSWSITARTPRTRDAMGTGAGPEAGDLDGDDGHRSSVAKRTF